MSEGLRDYAHNPAGGRAARKTQFSHTNHAVRPRTNSNAPDNSKLPRLLLLLSIRLLRSLGLGEGKSPRHTQTRRPGRSSHPAPDPSPSSARPPAARAQAEETDDQQSRSLWEAAAEKRAGKWSTGGSEGRETEPHHQCGFPAAGKGDGEGGNCQHA